MKINIEIDLDDFYAESFETDSEIGASPTQSLSGEVRDVIKSETKQAIARQVRDDVRAAAIEAYEEFGKEKIKTITEFEMNQFAASGMLKKHGKEISVTDHLRSIFEEGHRYNSVDTAMEKLGKQFSEECRKRYDMAHAMNIVSGLEKQGLLKEGVFEAITKES